MKSRRVVSALALAMAIAAGTAQFHPRAAAAPLRVLLSVPASQTTAALDGRMLLLVSTDQRTEPRFQVSDNDPTAQVFGVDVEGLEPGKEAVVDAGTLGYPVQSVSDIKPGDYGMKDEHCWSGDHEHVNAISRLTYNSRFIPLMAERWRKTAPRGADVTSWSY